MGRVNGGSGCLFGRAADLFVRGSHLGNGKVPLVDTESSLIYYDMLVKSRSVVLLYDQYYHS